MKETQYINTARAIGIILIVLGHSGFPLTNYIYLFHVPLFFFISGYLFKEEYISDSRLFLGRIFKRLYIPFIFINTLFLSINSVFVYLDIYSNQYTFKKIMLEVVNIATLKPSGDLMGASWFISCLIFTEIFYLIIRKLFKNERMLFLVGIFSMIISFIFARLGFNIPRNIDSAMMMLFIYILGNMYNKYEKKIKIPMVMNIISVGIMIVLIYVFNVKVDIVQDVYPNIILFILGEVVGIYIIISISKFIGDKIHNVVNIISKNTMYIMYFHFLSFKIVDVLYGNGTDKFPYNNSFWIVYLIVGIIIPVLMGTIINNFKENITFNKK